MTIDEIAAEIQEYLNENTNGLTYRFLSASEKDETTGINELSFTVQHHIHTWTFLLEYNLPQEKSSGEVHRGHVFHLELKEFEEDKKPNGSISGWIEAGIKDAEEGLNSKRSSRKRKRK